MKPFFTLIILSITLLLFHPSYIFAQCTTTSANDCVCPDGTLNCALLPDIKVSENLLTQAGYNPEVYGELRITVSTPNVGYGPLTVSATNTYVCGTDTLGAGASATPCPDGSFPKQLIKQTIYTKDGNSMIANDRWAGSMVYHPTHGHMHVDDWCTYALREFEEGVDPFDLPIVAEGGKLGFCLMDYGTCMTYDGYCTDDENTILNTEEQFPNYGLGGGGYQCGFFNQGISVGHTDIYLFNLDGMYITIPPDLCNGQYYLTVEVDPLNHFLEMNEDNNRVAVPITLFQQDIVPNPTLEVAGRTILCEGESTVLNANIGDNAVWSTGEEGTSIEVSESGIYTATSVSCNYAVEYNPVEVTVFEMPNIITAGDSLCEPGVVNLTAITDTGEDTGQFNWYDAPDSETPIFTGSNFETPNLTSTTNYFVSHQMGFEATHFCPPYDNTFGGTGLYSSFLDTMGLIFNVQENVIIKSVKVYAATDLERTFQLYDANRNLLQETTVFLADGEQRVDLNFEVAPGENYLLRNAVWPSLQRNSNNIEFPYEIPGLLSIIGSNNDEPDEESYYYYHYYDWEVLENNFLCESEKVPVTVNILDCTNVETITTLSAPKISISPNPSAGMFVLDVDLKNTPANQAHIYIMDVRGKMVYEQKLNNFEGNYQQAINLSDVTAGIYFLAVTTSNGNNGHYEKVVIH